MGEQSRYRVRFDWGVEGARAIGQDVDVLVWVDALDAGAPPVSALPAGCAVVGTGLAGAAETAAWVLALEEVRRAGTRVAVVAAGGDREGGLRFAAEDQLAAGSVLDELATRGIAAMSPEAAVAHAAYRALRTRVRSMVASVVGAGGLLGGGLRIHRQHPGLLESYGALVG